MVLITVRNPWARLALFALPLVIFAVVYFSVIRPDNNAANQAVKNGVQQAQQAVNQATKQVQGGAGQSGTAGESSNAVSQAANNATKLAACVAAAGTNAAQTQVCDAKYTP